MSHSFEALEGQYQYYNCSGPQYKEPQTGNIGVRLSFLENVPHYDSLDISGELSYGSQEWRTDTIYCYNIGKEIVVYLQENQSIPADRRVFKVCPTCHAFKPLSDDSKPILLVGLLNGEIQLISPIHKDTFKAFNEEKSIDKSPVTCISWVPDSPNQFLASHSSGHMYLYDEKIQSNTTPPVYELFKEGIGFSVYTCKAKSTRNPLYRWVFGARNSSSPSSAFTSHHNDTLLANKIPSHVDNTFYRRFVANEFKNDLPSAHLKDGVPPNLHFMGDDTASVNQFTFSPCGAYLALVTEDGYLRVLEYHAMELYGFMRSYFAGLLCVDWSPDSRFVVVGGQDDLVTVWSMQYRSVICRAEGHRSWVSTVRFDPYLCPPDTRKCSPSTSVNGCNSKQHQDQTRSELNSNRPRRFSSVDDVDDELMLGTYRIGSVGQDTLFCLWDLTEDVIRQGVQFFLTVAPTRLPNGILDESLSCGSNFPGPVVANPIQQTDENPVFLSTSPTSKRPHRSTGNMIYSPTTAPSPGGSVSSSGRSMSNLFGLLTFGRKKLTPTTPASTAPAKVSAPAFGSERIKSNSLVHRFSTHSTQHRNAGDLSSTTHSEKRLVTEEDMAFKCSSLNRSNYSSRLFEMNEECLFGSPMCPKFSDVPVIAPVVTTGMYQHRLTDLVFRRNSIHVVCQQGLIRAWSRPVSLRENPTSDSRLISLAESAQNTQPTTTRPTGSGFFPPAIPSLVSAQSPVQSSSDSSDCSGTDPFHAPSSTGRKTTESDEYTKSQLPFTPYRLTTTTAAPRAPPPTSSRTPNESGCIPTCLGLDYACGAGTGTSIAGPRGLGHTSTTSSSADV